MSAIAILTQIIELLVGGITGVASGIGQGLSTLVTSLAITGSGETATMSTFFMFVVIFAGISLAIGLCRWVVNFLTSLGARNR